MLFFFSLHPSDLACLVKHFVVDSQCYLRSVLARLVLLPGLLTHLLLERQLLVISLQFLERLLSLLLILILEHAPHARDGFSLLSVGLLVSHLLRLHELLLSNLLVSPVLLVLSVNHHPLPVYYNQSVPAFAVTCLRVVQPARPKDLPSHQD